MLVLTFPTVIGRPRVLESSATCWSLRALTMESRRQAATTTVAVSSRATVPSAIHNLRRRRRGGRSGEEASAMAGEHRRGRLPRHCASINVSP
jgi:hypothetical protein